MGCCNIVSLRFWLQVPFGWAGFRAVWGVSCAVCGAILAGCWVLVVLAAFGVWVGLASGFDCFLFYLSLLVSCGFGVI